MSASQKVRTRRLRQSDFANGPVFVDTPHTYVKVMEDIAVDFSDVAAPDESPFHHGFFGAIIIRASYVTIDLQKHAIAMTEAYRAKQRFFAIVEGCAAPLPPGKIGFDTEPGRHSHVTVKNGTLGASSHFAIHAVQCGDHWVLSDLTMKDYETGAVSISGGSFTTITDCTIGAPLTPLTTAREVMLRDLEATARKSGHTAVADDLASMRRDEARRSARMTRTDSLCRAIVIVPEFNVGAIKRRYETRIKNVTVRRTTFADIVAEPEEEIGIEGPDGEPLRDLHGNLILYEHVRAHHPLPRYQALLSPNLPADARRALQADSLVGAAAVRGFDLRVHDLRQKASLCLRVDGCDHVRIFDVRCGTVASSGPESASVGVMLNDCTQVIATNVKISGVAVDGADGASVMSDARPQAGLLMRNVAHAYVSKASYDSCDACACSFRDCKNVSVNACAFRAPSVTTAAQFRLD